MLYIWTNDENVYLQLWIIGLVKAMMEKIQQPLEQQVGNRVEGLLALDLSLLDLPCLIILKQMRYYLDQNTMQGQNRLLRFLTLGAKTRRLSFSKALESLESETLNLYTQSFRSSHLISSHLISSHLISSHLISSHLISSHPMHRILSHSLSNIFISVVNSTMTQIASGKSVGV